MMRTRIDVDVDAPGDRLFGLARDVARWPQMLPHYRHVTVVSLSDGTSIATMSAVREFGPLRIPVAWRSRTWAETDDARDLRLRFIHLRGATRGMDVTWHITPRREGTECNVAIEHDFSRPLPLLPADAFPWLVDRLFVRPIAGQTLRTFKRLAEMRTASW